MTNKPIMDGMNPRVRNLLRQAHKVAGAGKRVAAEQLYRQIIEEYPDTAEAWAGLGDVLADPAEQGAAYEQAISLNGENKRARRGLLQLAGESIPAELVEEVDGEEAVERPEPPPSASLPHRERLPVAQPAADAALSAPPEVDLHEEVALFCYRHPQTETALRCNRCGRPICIKCANRTSVGYRCPECLREIEADYYTAKPSDYLLATIVAAPLSVVAGYLVTLLGSGIGFFFFFFVAAIGGGIGAFIARLTHRAIGRRRGRYTPQLIAGLVAAGGLLPALAGALLLVITGNPFNLFGLLVPGIYALVAGSSAYYQIR